MKPSPYTIEFRRQAAEQVAALRDAGERRTVSAVAETLGVNPATLRTWLVAFGPPPAPEPRGTRPPSPHAGPVPRLPLLGLARHATCHTPLFAILGDNGPAYTCPTCQPERALDAERTYRGLVTAIARQAPRLARTITPDLLNRILLAVRIDNRCRTVALRWRPTGRQPSNEPDQQR